MRGGCIRRLICAWSISPFLNLYETPVNRENLCRMSLKVLMGSQKHFIFDLHVVDNNLFCSLFQAPREPREGEGEGAKRRGTGERKRRERRGACNHFLKHLMPPTFFKMCQHVKMSKFFIVTDFITRASFRVRAVVHTSLRCRRHRKVLRVWYSIPQKPVDFAKKF